MHDQRVSIKTWGHALPMYSILFRLFMLTSVAGEDGSGHIAKHKKERSKPSSKTLSIFVVMYNRSWSGIIITWYRLRKRC